MKKPSSLSNSRPQAEQALFTSKSEPSRNRVAHPQFGHRLRTPRETPCSRVTFMEAPRPASGSELEAHEPADLDVLAGLRDRFRQEVLNGLLGDLHEWLVQEAHG